MASFVSELTMSGGGSVKLSSIEDKDTRLSVELARALGYYPESVRVEWVGGPYAAGNGNVEWRARTTSFCSVYREVFKGGPDRWRPLDYRSPSVYGPLIKWLAVRKIYIAQDDFARWRSTGFPPSSSYDTFEEAVAQTVIALRESGQRSWFNA